MPEHDNERPRRYAEAFLRLTVCNSLDERIHPICSQKRRSIPHGDIIRRFGLSGQFIEIISDWRYYSCTPPPNH